MKRLARNIRIISLLFIVLFILSGCDKKEVTTENQDSPITVKAPRPGFATFTNSKHRDNTIGYRFFEHSPLVFGAKPKDNKTANLDTASISKMEESFAKRKGVLVYKKEVKKNDEWLKQDWTFYMAPVSDGIDVLLVVQTYANALPEYYGVQQCFRMSGKTNAEWRQKIARTPAFSEYDHWATEKEKKSSLTWVVRNGQWQQLPVLTAAVGARTPLGLEVDQKRIEGELPEKVGPYQALMYDPIDMGLITRTNKEGTWISGLYWQGTSHVTDHHPADCLHSIVNIGNIPPFSKRAVRGKIYWFKGSKEDLLKKFEKDFKG